MTTRGTRFTGGSLPLHYVPGEKRVKPNVTFHEEKRRVMGMPGFLREAILGDNFTGDSRVVGALRSLSRQKRLDELRQRKLEARLHAPPKESGEDNTTQEIARYQLHLRKETEKSRQLNAALRNKSFEDVISIIPVLAVNDPIGFIVQSARDKRSSPELYNILNWHIPTDDIRRALYQKPVSCVPVADTQLTSKQPPGEEWRDRFPRITTKRLLLPSRLQQIRSCESCRESYRMTTTDRALTSLSMLSL